MTNALAARTCVLALVAVGCGTQQWAFDAPSSGSPDGSVQDAGPSNEDAGAREDVHVAEASTPSDAAAIADSALDVADGGCSNDSDCSSTGLHCDVSSGQCVACTVDADCGAGRVCESLQCVSSCADGGVCPSATPICRAPRDVCVPCTANADCTPATTGHFCLTSTGQCVGCTANSDCHDGFCDLTKNVCENL